MRQRIMIIGCLGAGKSTFAWKLRDRMGHEAGIEKGAGEVFRKKNKKLSYDREYLKPVIRASICTGEQVAGFRDIRTGKFDEIMLIRNSRDMDEFLEMYGIEMGEVSKEW